MRTGPEAKGRLALGTPIVCQSHRPLSPSTGRGWDAQDLDQGLSGLCVTFDCPHPWPSGFMVHLGPAPPGVEDTPLSLSLSCVPPTLGPPSATWLLWTLAAMQAGNLNPWTAPEHYGSCTVRVTGTDPPSPHPARLSACTSMPCTLCSPPSSTHSLGVWRPLEWS